MPSSSPSPTIVYLLTVGVKYVSSPDTTVLSIIFDTDTSQQYRQQHTDSSTVVVAESHTPARKPLHLPTRVTLVAHANARGSSCCLHYWRAGTLVSKPLHKGRPQQTKIIPKRSISPRYTRANMMPFYHAQLATPWRLAAFRLSRKSLK